MNEWQIKYKKDNITHTEIFECGFEKASKVWEFFKVNYLWDRIEEEKKEDISLDDIRIIQKIK